MARLIVKNGYIKGGGRGAVHVGNMVKYIATREGVQRLQTGKEDWNATQKQQQFIAQVLRDFPDSKNTHEYDDYLREPTRGNATEFITAALEQSAHKLVGKQKYLDYIANRPRVEKIDTHGLFTNGSKPLVLAEVARELSAHEGNLWTPIISLRREDAQRLGYESAAQWQSILQGKAMEIANSLKIPHEHFRWYAAFHNESHHPHVHMICYSTAPTDGYLSKVGIEKMKSSLAREIFKQDLVPIYAEKTVRRDTTKKQTKQAMQSVIAEMKHGVVRNEKIELLITHLADRLQYTSGKKQYGYLHANLKNIVDEIVDELGREDSVAKAYQLWWEMKADVELTYSDSPSEILPLSKCAEFKSIKNMVIQEAVTILQGDMTFEESPKEEHEIPTPTTEAPSNADFFAGKKYVEGDGVLRDVERGIALLTASADSGNAYAQYALAALYLKGKEVPRDIEKALDYLQRAGAQGNPYAHYRLGKLYLSDEDVPKDTSKAVEHFTKSANAGHSYAQYTLGKLYLMGKDVEQDKEQAYDWFQKSAEQGNQYAHFFVDNSDKFQSPSALISATRLLHHASRVFDDKSPLRTPVGLHIDRKRRLVLSKKKQAQGHKRDDYAPELSL